MLALNSPLFREVPVGQCNEQEEDEKKHQMVLYPASHHFPHPSPGLGHITYNTLCNQTKSYGRAEDEATSSDVTRVLV